MVPWISAPGSQVLTGPDQPGIGVVPLPDEPELLLDDELELLEEELLDEELEEELELEDELLEDDEDEELLLDEDEPPELLEAVEHSFTPPEIRPPKVDSAQVKLPDSVL